MLDNQLIALIIRVLMAGESVAGIADTPIAQAFQPTQEGVNTEPTIFIHKISDHRYGFLGVSDVWETTQIVHTETQQYETMFQISTLALQNPKTPENYTASDIANLCCAILQSTASVTAFQAQGVGIERVTDVRNPYFLDDFERNEANPSFDFTLTHKQIITSITPILQSIELQVLEV